MFAAATFFDLATFGHQELFSSDTVWQALKYIKEYMVHHHYPLLPAIMTNGRPLAEPVILHNGEILSVTPDIQITYGDATKRKLTVTKHQQPLEGASVVMAGAVLLGEKIAIGKGVLVEPGALIKAPAIIGDSSEIRHGAYLRGYCLTGTGCVIGHTTEVKNSIFLNNAKAGHFAYLGDSILGNNVNLGAGTKLANLRLIRGEIAIRTKSGPVLTGLEKLGAILGDDVQTGCNSVTNPGTIMGKKSLLLPNVTAPSGLHAAGSLIK